VPKSSPNYCSSLYLIPWQQFKKAISWLVNGFDTWVWWGGNFLGCGSNFLEFDKNIKYKKRLASVILIVEFPFTMNDEFKFSRKEYQRC
jgi:hypothetical protein